MFERPDQERFDVRSLGRGGVCQPYRHALEEKFDEALTADAVRRGRRVERFADRRRELQREGRGRRPPIGRDELFTHASAELDQIATKRLELALTPAGLPRGIRQ